MRRALRPGGIAILSGLLDAQAREVRATYLSAGFRLSAQSSRDGWTALTLACVATVAAIGLINSPNLAQRRQRMVARKLASARMSWSETPYIAPFMEVSTP